MKTTTIAAAILIAALLPAPSVVAQAADRQATDADGWVPVKHLTFTPDDIESGLLGPDGELIEVVERAPQPSLIELREGFEAEVVKTMEDM